MKDLIKRISISLAIAVGEFALALLLLVAPGGFTSAVIVLLGIVLIVTGILSVIGYIRLPREEALKTWKLAAGAAGICAGIAAIVNRS